MGELREKANKFMSPVQGHYSQLEIEKASGVYLYGLDGHKYLDFSSGIAVTNTGHAHPKIVEAITEQAEKLIHICAGVAYYPTNIELAEKIVDFSPFDKASVF